ncbi:MAG: cell division protein ZapA [Bacteriovoracaceae bacterium]
MRELEYDLLGHKVRLTESVEQREATEGVEPKQVIEKVSKLLASLKDTKPNLSDVEIAIMASLELAEENLKLRDEFLQEISRIEHNAKDALQYLKDVTPN